MTNENETGIDFIADFIEEVLLKIKGFFLRIKSKKVVRKNNGKFCQNR